MDANNGPSSLDPNDLRAVSSEDMDNDGKTPDSFLAELRAAGRAIVPRVFDNR